MSSNVPVLSVVQMIGADRFFGLIRGDFKAVATLPVLANVLTMASRRLSRCPNTLTIVYG